MNQWQLSVVTNFIAVVMVIVFTGRLLNEMSHLLLTPREREYVFRPEIFRAVEKILERLPE